MKKNVCKLLAAAMAVSSFSGMTAMAEENATYEVATVRWSDWGDAYHTGFPDQAAAETGIEIEWNSILNADWGDRKAVLLAGGDLPDAFMGSICFGEADVLRNVGTFIALDEYIDEYMPNFKAILESDPTMKALATAADGHIYGLPSKKPCRPTVANQMFINQTWLDNLGLEMPTTYEEFVDVLRAFKEQDANGNGDTTDEIPGKNQQTYEFYQKLAGLKKEKASWQEGGMKFLYAKDQILALARFYGNEVYIGIMSTNDKAQRVRLPIKAVGVETLEGYKEVFGTRIDFEPADDKAVWINVEPHQAYLIEC